MLGDTKRSPLEHRCLAPPRSVVIREAIREVISEVIREVIRECKAHLSSQVKSNQVKSNQVKSRPTCLAKKVAWAERSEDHLWGESASS